MSRSITFEPHADRELVFKGAPAMTISQISAALRRLTYLKPGWYFETVIGCPEHCILHITTSFVDHRDPRADLPFVYHLVGPVYSPAQLWDAIGQGIADIETHEFREALRVDGKPLWDPHPPDGNFVVRGSSTSPGPDRASGEQQHHGEEEQPRDALDDGATTKQDRKQEQHDE